MAQLTPSEFTCRVGRLRFQLIFYQIGVTARFVKNRTLSRFKAEQTPNLEHSRHQLPFGAIFGTGLWKSEPPRHAWARCLVRKTRVCEAPKENTGGTKESYRFCRRRS